MHGVHEFEAELSKGKAIKKFVSGAICSLLVVVSAAAWSATQTVTLAVSGMTWNGCVTSVQRSLKKVAGVSKAAVSLEKKEAVVTFDDAKTNVDALVKATTAAGYPSSVKKE